MKKKLRVNSVMEKRNSTIPATMTHFGQPNTCRSFYPSQLGQIKEKLQNKINFSPMTSTIKTPFTRSIQQSSPQESEKKPLIQIKKNKMLAIDIKTLDYYMD
jgi:hypothetical protein